MNKINIIGTLIFLLGIISSTIIGIEGTILHTISWSMTVLFGFGASVVIGSGIIMMFVKKEAKE